MGGGASKQKNSSPKDNNITVKRAITSVLAGFAWDEKNIFNTKGKEYLNFLSQGMK